ncbi:hypothetical protein OCOJLMKI_3061 [Methylobacterium iners]|uniref:EAL domain-containing protein n=2 Tax=Methylobacterium iners TaxID=418707 RepID=A0ABQ4RZL7_9HYPH|nr:hypothetical protein OCOJLMKI_3061 [Methylobacterium iners]
MDDKAFGGEIEIALLDRAIDALRTSGRFVRKLPGSRDSYFIDDGSLLTAAQVVALAWSAGLMGGSEGMQ